MVDDGTELFGVKPPSTRALPIPKSELTGKLYAFEGNVSDLYHLFAPTEIAYSDVTIKKSNLSRLIKRYLTEYVAEARRYKK